MRPNYNKKARINGLYSGELILDDGHRLHLAAGSNPQDIVSKRQRRHIKAPHVAVNIFNRYLTALHVIKRNIAYESSIINGQVISNRIGIYNQVSILNGRIDS